MIRVAAFAALAAAALVTQPLSAATTYFYDSQMAEADYATTVFSQDPGYTTAVDHYTDYSNGPGNQVMRFTYQKSGANPGGSTRLITLNNSFVYDPSTQGTITSIDAAMLQRISLTHSGQTVPLTGVIYFVRLLARQGDAIYEADFGIPDPAVVSGNRYVSQSGIVASDFTLFDTDNPFAPRTQNGLDFSAGPITFGFANLSVGVLVNGGPATGLSRYAFFADNFNVNINADEIAPVPEPGEWAMMIAGLAIVGAAARKRRSA